MSMSTSISYGYGLSKEDLYRIPDDNLAAFAKKYVNKDFWEDDIETMSDDDILAALECYEDTTSSEESPYCVISNTLTEKTGIEFAYECTEYGEALMYYATYPWYMKDTEKDLTPNKLQEIVQPYLNELGIPDAKLDYASVERYS